MNRRITKAEAQAWRDRWRLVNDAELEELRKTPPAVKLQQLAVLMASARQLGWTEALAVEDDAVRERWQRLRKTYGV